MNAIRKTFKPLREEIKRQHERLLADAIRREKEDRESGFGQHREGTINNV